MFTRKIKRLKKIIKALVALSELDKKTIRTFFQSHDTQYRDIVDLLSHKSVRHNSEITLETDHPVAYESLDHLTPAGTINDNTRNYAFYTRCRSLYGDNASFLDIGCSGGGLVFDFALNGHLAIGLEGSDHSQKIGRANWRTIPNNLMTCDVTKPFRLYNTREDQAQKFDVISCWEVLEHIQKDDLGDMFQNVRDHLAPEGIFIGSISKTPGTLHVCVQENDWWSRKFNELGFETKINDYETFPLSAYCRGQHYQEQPDKGLHFIATMK